MARARALKQPVAEKEAVTVPTSRRNKKTKLRGMLLLVLQKVERVVFSLPAADVGMDG